MRAIGAFFALGALSAAHAAAFTPGNIAVLRAGDGTLALSSTSAGIFIDEYTPAGVFVQSLTIASNGANALTISGSSTSEGALTRSPDGRLLSFAGYRTAIGLATVANTASATVPRAVGIVDPTGNFGIGATTVFQYGGASSAGNIRSGATDGQNNFWAGGTANTAATQGGINYLGNTTISNLVLGGNLRWVNIINNELYFSSGSATAPAPGIGIFKFSGRPVSAAVPTTVVLGGTSPYGFSINPGGTILYVADDGSGIGIRKYVFSGGSWNLAYQLNQTAARGLVVDWGGANPVIYATTTAGSANTLIKITDNGAGSPAITLATAPANTAFRGVALTPALQPLTLTCPVDIARTATSMAGAVVTYSNPTVSDGCSPTPPTPSCNPPSGSTFPVGTSTVTCFASDPCNQTASCSFKVTVTPAPPLVLTCPANITTPATSPGGAVVTYPPPTVSGGCDSPPPVPICNPPSGSTFPVGTTTVNCSANGSCSFAGCSFTVTVTAPPLVLTCPSNITTPATSSSGAVVTYPPPTVSGGCDSPPPVPICNPPSGSTFPVGTTTVNCTANGSCGFAFCSFTVTVQPSAPERFFGSNLLPPPAGMYISPAKFHQLYANGIILSNISHRRFLQSDPPPPGGGPPQTHSFGSLVQMMISVNGGQTFSPVSAPAQVTVQVGPSAVVVGDKGPVSTHTTEMLGLDISGGGLPAGVMIRESPTRASTGQTTVRQVEGGYMIGSFFDIFTEVSVDGGANWVPAQDAAHVELRGDPAAIPPVPASSPLLPPPNNLYVSPALYHLLLSNGIVVKDIKHRFFTQSLPAPDPAGPARVHHFDSQVDMQLSRDGGNTFSFVRAPAAVDVQVTPRSSFDGVAVYDTEMLSLNIQGGDLPPGIMLRESPTIRSEGGTGIEPVASDGTQPIHSFFDIFVEVSTDNGANWTPAAQAGHVELVPGAAEVPKPSPNLPPPGGQYISPAAYHALYAMGIVIKDLRHSGFTQSLPPPPPGGSQTHQFDSQVQFQLSTDAGNTFHPASAPAQVRVRVDSTMEVGTTRYFNTEMLSLDIQGGSLPAGVMLRESPTRQSLGRTSIRAVTDAAGGTRYYIDSFFDIFTEISLDGGQNWSPQVGEPAEMAIDAQPAPCTIAVTCPGDITASATGPAGAVVNYAPPTVTATCTPANVVCNPPSGSTFPVGTTTVTCTANDSQNNTSTCSFKITVRRAKPGFFPNPILPPPNGVYISPSLYHQLYANGIIIRDIRHRRFTGGQTPPPLGGPPQIHQFGSIVELEHSMDGGATFHKVSASANCSVRVIPTGIGTYDTEMLQLDIAGGSLPPGVMIRESPTLASTGQTTVRQVNGGFLIDSFFDVFTEISLDGGANWSPAQDAAHVELRPDIGLVTPIPAATRLLPPPNDAYISPAQFHILAAQGIVIKDVRHSFFTPSTLPPIAGTREVHQFNSQVDMLLSRDGGNTFQAVRAPAAVTVEVEAVGSADSGFYDTEMLALDIQGGGLPPGVMIRESPTLPSRGMVAIDAAGPHPWPWNIGSFFDIFTEVTLDGGQNWLPAQSPARVELTCDSPEQKEPNPNLPPLDGQYISPQKFHALYAQGIVISNVTHRRFTQSQPPPPPGGSQVHTFNSDIDMMISMNNGATWSHVQAPASVQVRVTSTQDEGDTRYFETEMLSLNISGGGLPGGVMVRESPSKASLGRTSIRMVNDPATGIWDYISSFFDIFTEASLDGGQNWLPALGEPVHMVLQPAPCAVTISCPPNITAYSYAAAGKVVNFTVIGSDLCTGPLTPVCNPPSGSTFPVGTTTVTCTASSPNGSASCSFTVTVIRRVLTPKWFPRALLPPPEAEYISPQRYHQLYANGIIISNVSHRRFLQSFPPPAPGTSETHSFGSEVDGEVSLNGGQTFNRFSGSADVTVRVTHSGSQADGTQFYDTEMLALNLTTPAGIMVRESPTRQSLGRTTVRTNPGGGFLVGSFFDVFTEISLDGGVNWSPAQDAAPVELHGDAKALTPIVEPTRLLPPPNGAYVSPQQYHLLLQQGIVIRNVSHKFFTQSLPPPDPGLKAAHSFSSQVDLELSQDGGQTFRSVRAPADVTVGLELRSTEADGTQTYDTEMLQLDIRGGGLPAGVMIRESPTLASEGGTAVTPTTDGQDRIGSFFDIFTEVSLDGGANWTPAPGPAHVQLTDVAPPIPLPNPNLPPLGGQYVSPQQWHALYAQGIIISNVAHKRFTQTFPPPVAGVLDVHSFGSQIECDLSLNGGQTWQHTTLPAQVTVSVRELASDGDTRYFETEMLALNISGGALPAGVMIRESPTLASLGRTSIRMVNDPATGIWDYISSFFDVFTEVSIDGGQNWQPSLTGPGEVRLVPLPAQCALAIQCPADISLLTRVPNTVVNYPAPTVTGDCPPFNVVCNPPSGGAFPVGMTTVNCTATDSSGNTATCSFKVTLVRVPPPVKWFPTPLLPPPQGEYISPQRFHQLYANGIIISNVSHRRFLQSSPPPAPGTTETHSFGSEVDAEVSTDGGHTYSPVVGNANVTVRMTHVRSDADGTQTYDTEMLALNLTAPGGLMLRESPTRASTGRTTVQPNAGGGFLIGSFFDVFTEISLDGGVNWSPAQDAAPVELHGDAKALTPVVTPTRLLPPPNHEYVSPQQYHLLAAQGIVIRDVRHKYFTQSLPPPEPGARVTHAFDSQVDMQFSTDGGQTFRPARAPGGMTVALQHRSSNPDGSMVYDTEMLALDIHGGDLPPGVMIRESPTLASEGGTTVTPTADGQFRLGSFFDIFTEVSLDGGANWTPISGPAHVELTEVAPPIPLPNPNLPPQGGQYVSPQQWHALYQQGIIISNVAHKRFTQTFPPPPAGVLDVHTFSSVIECDLSLNAGQTWQHVTLPAQVTVSLRELASDGDTRYFETEMLALNISGGALPAGVMVRESPSRASLGRTSIRMVNDPATGIWDYISSFFDVFTELSIDGGQNWSPSLTGPGEVKLKALGGADCVTIQCPADILAECQGPAGTPVTFAATANSTCDPVVNVICTPASGGTFPLGTTPVTCTARDGQGNSASCTFNVVVRDTRPPTITCPQPLIAECQGPNGTPVNYVVSATDVCDSTVAIVCTPPSGSNFPVGVTTVTCAAVDDTGNKATCSFSVTVRDTRAPTINCSADIVVNNAPPNGAAVVYTTTATDTCDSSVIVSCNPPSGSTFPIGMTTVNCTATDHSGNAVSCSFKVTVNRGIGVANEVFFKTNTLPPKDGVYISPARFHQLYANGIIVTNARHRAFTRTLPPPPAGQSQTHQFSSTVEFDFALGAGLPFRHAVAQGIVTVRVTGRAGQPGVFDTEMLALDVHGGTLPPGVMLRESPTRQSTGQTSIRQVPGGYMIGSFFDVFTEVTTDNGQNWVPAPNPVHVEVRRDPMFVQAVATPNNLLPPRNEQYVSPAQFHALYAAGIVIKDVRHSFFTRAQPPPAAGGSGIHIFGSQVDMMVSLDGGQTFRPMRAPADVTVQVNDEGGDFYDTEMLALNVQGGDLPANMRLRESPTEASRGGTLQQRQPDGSYKASSFFDIFTELSLDGGQTWNPASGPVRMELRPKAPPAPFLNPNLPPTNGAYISPVRLHALYAQGIVISNVTHRRFTQNLPPPPPLGTNVHTFDSEVQMMVSMNGGSNFTQVTAPAMVNVRVASTDNDMGDTRYFDTEMLSLDIHGGGLPPNVMVRESPSRASLGRTSLRQPGATGGDVGKARTKDASMQIGSFFDIFTEVSTDGGQTWNPSQSPPVNMMLENETSPPCPGPASMQVARGDNSVTITWTGGDFRLQVTDELKGGQTVWQDIAVSSPVTLIVNPDQAQFYRVTCP